MIEEKDQSYEEEMKIFILIIFFYSDENFVGVFWRAS